MTITSKVHDPGLWPCKQISGWANQSYENDIYKRQKKKKDIDCGRLDTIA